MTLYATEIKIILTAFRVIDDAPALLYVKGTMPDFDNIPAVCIVGPRKVTEKGKMASYSIARRLALSGMTVVSGGALGCDSAAHSGALKADGITALVMGCGILSESICRKTRAFAKA